jgi:hypothetical protein
MHDLGIASFAFYTGQLTITGSENPDTGPISTTVPMSVTLDGWSYALELAEYSFGPQDTFRDGVVANDQPNESLFNARGAWSRYRVSWHRGADQEIADLDESADPFRFNTSHGFDPWTKYRLQLLPEARIDDDVTVDSADPQLLRSGIYLFHANNLELLVTETGNTWNSMTPPGGTIYSLATDGNDLYVGSSAGLVKYIAGNTISSAFATPVTDDTHKVAFVANRLLVGQSNVLNEVGADGTLTEVITHFQDEFRWTTIFAIGSRIYVGGYAGIKSELYTLTTDDTGVLVQGQEAAPFPIGEQLLCALGVGGAVMLGTSLGVRFAQVGADGTLTYGPQITTPGACRAMAGEGRYVWVTWNDITTQPTGFKGLARLDLATFVDVLQPAFAADVQVHADVGDIVTVERFNDQVWFDAADAALYHAADDGDFGDIAFETTATITSGRLYFGTVERKGLVEFEVDFSPLESGSFVQVRILDQDGVTIAQGLQDIVGSTTLLVDLVGALTREATVELEVTQQGEQNLIIYNWAMRAYPVPPPVLQWILPINTHETVEIGESEGRDMSQARRGVVDRIEALHASRRLVNYLEGDRLYRVRVESFKHQARMWSDDGSAPVGVLQVQLVSA